MNNLWIVDAFTPVAFRGNPAAVYLLSEFPSDAELQLLAAQANLSDTAFVVHKLANNYDLRWFTPKCEIQLCGHATLAAAHVLHQMSLVKTGEAVSFNTLSGVLQAKIQEDGIELNFPALPGGSVKPDPALSALGVEIIACEKNRDDFLVEVKDFNTLISIKPDMKKLAKANSRGVIVTTAKGIEGFDFASRFFAPGLGINEDPVTGSIHCFLAPYWAKKLDKTSFHALQASRARGVLDIILASERTLIKGKCVTTIQGKIHFSNNINKQKYKKGIPA